MVTPLLTQLTYEGLVDEIIGIKNCEYSLVSRRIEAEYLSRSPRRATVISTVTTKRAELESKDDLKRRIDEATRYIDPDQLCLSPQCGFASTEEGNALSYEQQVAKLRLVVETATEIWG